MATAPAPLPTLTVGQALTQAVQAGLDRLDAQLLMTHVLIQPRSWLLAHDDHVLSPTDAQTFSHLLNRRQQGEPLAYLLGEKEFFGLALRVTPDVLVPRADTETLVDWALTLMDGALPSPCSVLDMGTGSGAIALAIQHQRPEALVTATDASAAALVVAMGNAQQLQLPVRFVQGRWFSPWQHSPEHFDLIVSNPPYIAEGDPHLPALRHEPGSALTAGPDGLDDIRILAAQAPKHLKPGGWLLLEHGHDQHQAVQALLTQAGFTQVSTRPDLAGIPRCTGGQMLQHGL